ncbi:Bodo-specific multi-copy gene family, putative [Bodo saltans]|uniref:Bodo-specific multi-copy gene family, putative n=1 Tax=Bodo saltans TaxID=75058 RepID=A0A0S4JVZ2_BODSA|nr:Bodo-specific multi-copy gene family, putative [Bodo saltans]|eukprot:CUG94474.1 Bodo-specific multi-copy gene family, putative [Bodo saltans]
MQRPQSRTGEFLGVRDRAGHGESEGVYARNRPRSAATSVSSNFVVVIEAKNEDEAFYPTRWGKECKWSTPSTLSRTLEAVCEPIYHWAGGVARLLRLAHVEEEGTISLACGSLDGFSRCFMSYKDKAASMYPITAELAPHAYSCLLVSSTKTEVNIDDAIFLNPAWKKTLKNSNLSSLAYGQAMSLSIESYKADAGSREGLFIVPPITFDDNALKDLDAPILPSKLHPFIDAGVSAHFGRMTRSENESSRRRSSTRCTRATCWK